MAWVGPIARACRLMVGAMGAWVYSLAGMKRRRAGGGRLATPIFPPSSPALESEPPDGASAPWVLMQALNSAAHERDPHAVQVWLARAQGPLAQRLGPAPVVLKFLPPSASPDSTEPSSSRSAALRALKLEAQAYSLMAHPAIPPLLLQGTLPTRPLGPRSLGAPGSPGAFVAIRHIPWPNLAQLQAQEGGAWPWPRVLRLLLGLSSALSHAHQSGVVHRDLKPENVLVQGEAQAIALIDFGVAHFAQGDKTATGVWVGSPARMAPEQLEGLEPTPATDVYALGMLAYELIAGRLPFESSGAALLREIQHTPPKPLHGQQAGLPPALADGIVRALQKSPAQRWPSMAAWRAQLESLETTKPEDGLPP
jgi:serine/threonine protein kinase